VSVKIAVFDADDFAIHVDQRSAGIAWVNGGIGLNERLKLPVGNDVAAFCGDNASGDRRLQPERTAYREHPVADLHAVRVAKFCDRKGLVDIDFDNREIGFLIAADYFGVVLGAGRIILQLDSDAVSLLDYVTIGDDESFGVHKDTGAE